VSTYGLVNVGPYKVARIQEGEVAHLFAVLRDDAITSVKADDEDAYQLEFSMPGKQVADRLDVLSIDQQAALEDLGQVIAQHRRWASEGASRDDDLNGLQEHYSRERDYLDRLTPENWITELRSHAVPSPDDSRNWGQPGSLPWLLELIDGLDYRTALRLGLLAFPNEQVAVGAMDRGEGWLEGDNTTAASDALQVMQALGSTYSPTVVLAEGKTDAEFLRDALSVLYPHLTDLVRFMDFGSRPEGGAAALVRSIKSFAAAGISNRTVALFDNDSAAEDAMRALDRATLPASFYVGKYPELEIARDYPTLWPPSTASPAGLLSTSNVNGFAGSIELYLGTDVLTGTEGALRPVQWTSYIPAVRRYQGEVTSKKEIHDLYRAKVATARRNGGPLESQDWSGLHKIMQLIIHAHSE
jgi:hypothetical protein